MAIFSLADINAIMPQFYRELVVNIQRKAVAARILQWKTPIDAKGPAWAVSFAGQDAGTVNSDGGARRTAAADPTTAATLGWGEYSAPVKVTEKAQWVGAYTKDHDYLKNLISRNAKEATEALVKLINQHIYTGTGTSNQMTGLSLANLNSGTYANINSSTWTGWKCSVTSNNSGTPQNLTLAQIKADLAAISIDPNNHFGRPDFAFLRSTPFNTLATAFDAFTMITYDPKASSMSLPQGGAQRVTNNPNVISTAGGQIQRHGFRVLRWDSEDLWLVEDPDCTHTGQTNPTGTMHYLNSASCWMEYLPPPSDTGELPINAANSKVIQATEQDLGPIANLQFKISGRGNQNWATELDILGMVQFVCTNRASIGYRTDIQ